MRYLQIVPNDMTFYYVLKATAHLGDVQVAHEALQEMKAHRIEIKERIYSMLIYTYAGACKVAGTTEKQIDAYIRDTWTLFRQMEQKKMRIVAKTLNGLILLYGNALRDSEVEGLVLPLFKKYNIAYDTNTYINLMSEFIDKK
eukprot:TRINITY_DN456_c0_g1_i5.p2 TRINITY_DN456_c0_g1~~TRINITY_DN456_c0_g1_i5.p2  ORF type:complete len:143 (+),score=44.35 TRINITY_DN456_c0_g1_i5:1060-1488(+)